MWRGEIALLPDVAGVFLLSLIHISTDASFEYVSFGIHNLPAIRDLTQRQVHQCMDHNTVPVPYGPYGRSIGA